jgi:hypothetical protein
MKFLVVRVGKTEEGKFGAIELIALNPTFETAFETVSENRESVFLEKITGFKSSEYCYAIIEVNDYTIY